MPEARHSIISTSVATSRGTLSESLPFEDMLFEEDMVSEEDVVSEENTLSEENYSVRGSRQSPSGTFEETRA